MELPQPFIDRTRTVVGAAVMDHFLAALEEDSPLSIRINPAKMEPLALDSKVPWCENGYYLPQRLHYTFDPYFHAGAYYVQEASSMFLDQVIRQYVREPVRYLDLCASPGGKTTLALSALPVGSLVVANEVVPVRASILVENLQKWGSSHTVVTRSEPAVMGKLESFFDVISVDAPCSGEGMFRKDPVAIREWSEKNVWQCASRQQTILSQVWRALRPGGLLIYSTCTYNREENEEMIQWLIDTYGVEPLSVDLPEGVTIGSAIGADFPAYRFMPHLTRGEGLFMAVMRKPEHREIGALPTTETKRKEKRKEKRPHQGKSAIPDIFFQWLLHPEAFIFERNEEQFRALPVDYKEAISQVEAVCNVLYAGIELGKIKGKDVLPQPALALSEELNRAVFTAVELSLSESLSYLRRESLALSEAKNGILLTVFEGLPLGWAKAAGIRANNNYPQEWRIRSGFTPEELLRIGSFCPND